MAQKTQMKPVPPGSLEVGKTYYATNLGGGRRQWQAPITANPIPDGPASAFSPSQRFVVTIAKNEPAVLEAATAGTARQQAERARRERQREIEFPHNITLKDIKLIVGTVDEETKKKGSVLKSYEPSTFTPLWSYILKPADVPKFYERKAAGLMMKKAFLSRKGLQSGYFSPTHGVLAHAMSYGGRRKSKRRRRTRGRRRKGKRTRRLRRRKKKRRTRR